MIRSIMIFSTFFCALIIIPQTVVFAAENTEKLVAKVGSMQITEKDYQRELNSLIPMSVGYHGGMKPEKMEKIEQEALQNIIDRAYKFQYALREEIALDSKQFDKAWSEQADKLKNGNASEDDLASERAAFYQKMLARKAEEVAVDSKVVVTEEQIKSHFEKNRERFKQPRQYTASHIFIKVDPSERLEEKAKKRERAQALYEKALSGEDFYNLAYYNSDDRSRYVGGSLGKFKAGQTVKAFDSALSNMKVGEVTGPIQTIYGFHVIKLDSVEEERLLTFDEVANLMRQQYRQMERQSVYNSWMDELKKTFPAEIFSKD